MRLELEFFLNEPVPLNPCRGWPKKAVHAFNRKEAIAIMAAKAIRRPLLVRGEPGCGKTQLARAAAQLLKMPLACLVVNERTETEDLFWRYDALRRLSDANTEGVQDEKKYLSAGPLWWALNPENAEQYEGNQSCKPYMGDGKDDIRENKNGVLLLIDEIDKADRSVPNSLLEALGNYSFQVPYINQTVENPEGQEAPLVIITSNDEQSLPPAFLRRCLVLNMKLDDSSEEAFVKQMELRGRALIKAVYESGDVFESDGIYRKLAKQLWEKRKKARESGHPVIPGQAEYFDHLEALRALKQSDSTVSEEDWITELSELTYNKHAL